MKTTVTTNFSLGNKVYIIKNNEIISDKVEEINIEINNEEPYIKYYLENEGGTYTEKNLFYSKRQAMHYLINKVCSNNGYEIGNINFKKTA